MVDIYRYVLTHINTCMFVYVYIYTYMHKKLAPWNPFAILTIVNNT